MWTCNDYQSAAAYINSAIPSRVAFLLLNGGQVGTISVLPLTLDDAEQLYIRTIQYFGPNQNPVFEDAREAMIGAAGDMWPQEGDRHCQIKNAWAAVGVGRACATDTGR